MTGWGKRCRVDVGASWGTTSQAEDIAPPPADTRADGNPRDAPAVPAAGCIAAAIAAATAVAVALHELLT